MRKSFIATLALGALVIASCQKENDYAPKAESPVFTASFDTDAPATPDTKTVLNGKKSEWVSGDAIRVLNGTNTTGCDAVYTTTDNGATASFTTTTEGYTGTQFIAMYPASPAGSAWWNGSVDKTVNKLWLSPEQEAVENGYDPKAHIAVAYTKSQSFSFSNAVALLKFTCGSDNITEVCVYANGTVSAGQNILSGNLSFNTKEKAVITGSDSEYVSNKYVKVKGSFVKGSDYYIACLPTTFTEGFTVEVVSNGTKGEDKTTSKEYTLKRNTILNLGTIEYKEKTINTRILYLDTGKWNVSSPKYDAWIWGGEISGQWVDFEQASIDGKYYKVTIPKGITGINIYRRGQEQTSHQFDDNYWNKVKDVLSIDDTINCITITDWDNSATTSTDVPII